MPPRRHLPSFIDELCSLRIKGPRIRRDAAVHVTQSFGGSEHGVSSHVIDPEEEGEGEWKEDENKARVMDATTADARVKRERTPYGSAADAASTAGARQFPPPTPPVPRMPPAQPQPPAATLPTIKGKLTPAKRAAMAAALAAQQAEEKKAATRMTEEVKAPPPRRPPLPPTATSARPTVPASVPTPAAAPAAAKPAKRRRPRCQYGARCYRKNPVHKQDESHPGDPDWNEEEDEEEQRPRAAAAGKGRKAKATAKGKGGRRGRSDEEEDEYDGDYMDWEEGSGGRRRPRRSATKVRSYAEVENSEDEREMEARDAENTQDREFIAPSDEEPEVYASGNDSDADEWGIQPTKKRRREARLAKKRSKKDEDDEEYNESGEDEDAADEEEDEEMELLEEELPRCQYGASCRRKNPEHFRQYRHPHVNTDMTPKVKDEEDASTSRRSPTASAKKQKPNATAMDLAEESPPPVLPLSRSPPAAAAASAAAPSPSPPASSGPPALPSLFKGLEAYIHGAMPDATRKTITRFWRAFDGDLVLDPDRVSMSTTHLITDADLTNDNDDAKQVKEMFKRNPDLIIVRSGWAMECIKRKQLVDEAPWNREKELEQY